MNAAHTFHPPPYFNLYLHLAVQCVAHVVCLSVGGTSPLPQQVPLTCRMQPPGSLTFVV